MPADINAVLPVHEHLIICADSGSPYELFYQEDHTAIELDGGFNSRAWQVGEFTLKVSKQTYTQARAVAAAHEMAREYQLVRAHHAPESVVPTSFWVINREGTERNHVLTMQPFVEGVSLAEHVARAETADETDAVRWFLDDSLEMFGKTGKIADLASIEKGFNALRTRNVIIQKDGTPVLVDVCFGKVQRSRLLGRAWSNGIAWGVQRALQALNPVEQ